jgi:hypothetical protein
MNKFIHQSSAFCLAFLMLARILAMPLSMLDYSLNKGFIINNLCENRSRPEIHCTGKCFLNKQLSKSNENKESGDQKGTVKSLVIDLYVSVNKPEINSITELPRPAFFFNISSVSGKFPDNIFHPPIV